MSKTNIQKSKRVETGEAKPGSLHPVCSAAPQQTTDTQGRDWLRVVIMVENTEANRTICRVLPEEARRLAERFQGRKIVKCEALQVWAMSHTKEEPPKAEAQQNK